MARFKFRLDSLLRLREATRDQRRRHLGEALSAEAILRQRRLALEKNIDLARGEARQATAPGPLNVDELLSAQRYELTLRGQLALLEQQASQLETEIAARRQALVEADREVRVLEKLRERHLDRFRMEQTRAAAKQMDEIALEANYRRRRTSRHEEASP